MMLSTQRHSLNTLLVNRSSPMLLMLDPVMLVNRSSPMLLTLDPVMLVNRSSLTLPMPPTGSPQILAF
jgi:hypothetical protein